MKLILDGQQVTSKNFEEKQTELMNRVGQRKGDKAAQVQLIGFKSKQDVQKFVESLPKYLKAQTTSSEVYITTRKVTESSYWRMNRFMCISLKTGNVDEPEEEFEQVPIKRVTYFENKIK